MRSSTVTLQQKSYTYILRYLEQNFFFNFLLFPPEKKHSDSGNSANSMRMHALQYFTKFS